MKTVLLTGATGFLGSYLAKGFLDNGYQVAAYRRNQSNLERLNNYDQKIKWFNLDQNEMDLPFLKHQIDIVVHTATSYGRTESVGEVIGTNLLFPVKIFERCTQFGVKMFVNTDSFYNLGYLQQGEYANEFPSNYSLSKKQLLDWLMNWKCSVKVINMNLQHIYGPYDNDDKFIPYVITNCLNNVEQLNLTSGQQNRNFIYIKDVVNAYLAVLQNDSQNQLFEEYEVGSSDITTIRQVVELIKTTSDSYTELLFGALPYRSNEIFEISVNTMKLQSIGWNQEYLLEEGIKETIERMKSLH